MNLGDLWRYPFLSDVWGTVGQWAGSVLTGLSLILAFRILQINQEDKRRAQAMKVTFTQRLSARIDNDNLASSARGIIWNASDAPITGIYIGVELKKSVVRKQFSRLHVLKNPLAKFVAFQEVFTDEEFATIPAQGKNEYYKPIDVLVSPDDVVVTLLFSDAHGRYWVRDNVGMLVEENRPSPTARFKKPFIFGWAWAIDQVKRTPEGDRYTYSVASASSPDAG
jgi:hypothetical protein